MDLKHLTFFLKLSETLHFARAAEELGLVQSALSRQIMLLERELGCRLFDRSNRWKVTLTAAGQALIPEIRKLLAQAETAKNIAAAAARGEQGRISLGLISSVLNLPRFLHALREMQSRYPHIHLTLQEGPSNRIYEAVRHQDIDLGILRMAPLADEEFGMRLLTRDRLMMAMPKGHPLSTSKRLSIRDFRRERFIITSANDAPLHRGAFDALCRNAGFAPDIVQEIENMTTTLRILAAQNCVALVPASYQGKFEDLAFRFLEDCSLELPVSAVWRRENTSPVLKNLLRILNGGDGETPVR